MPPRKIHYEDLSKNRQISIRPEMYIGSMSGRQAQTLGIIRNDLIESARINVAPGLLRIFIEILCNAADNVVISRELHIDPGIIEVMIHDQMITVRNGGNPMRVERMMDSNGHEDWIPSIMFSSMFSSSHYHEQDRYTAGLNGIGAKACNTFSSHFEVEVSDGISVYRQRWERCHPTMQATVVQREEAPYVQVSFVPDMSFFQESLRLDECSDVIEKMASDLSLCTRVPVHFTHESRHKVYHHQGAGIQVAMAMRGATKYATFQHSGHCLYLFQSGLKGESFVNATPTRSGGNHVNSAMRVLCDAFLQSKLNRKQQLEGLTSEILTKHLSYVLCSTVRSPAFDGNNKDRLVSDVPEIPLDPVLQFVDELDLILPSLVTSLTEIIRAKNAKSLNKRLGKGRTPPTYIKAYYSGKSRKHPVTLWITEGLSAQTYVKDMIIATKGNYDYDGILPLQGVPISVRANTHEKIKDNAQVEQLQNILGLEVGANYQIGSKAYQSLRYDRVVIATDADVDGYHIRNLVIDLFQIFAPSLLQLGYLYEMQSPIIRLNQPKQQLIFYNKDQWAQYTKRMKKIVGTVQYCKGLGSSSPKDTHRDAQEGLDRILRPITTTGEDEQYLSLAFDPHKAQERKSWITNPTKQTYDEKALTIAYSIHHDLREFSIANIKRTIRSWDGFNESQRMIAWSMLQKCHYKRKAIKMDSVSGHILDQFGYEHGSESLTKTIKHMGVGYPGTNNLPLLYPEGNFGTRDAMGRDAAASRYLSTALRDFVPYLLMECDEELLVYTEEHGASHGPDFLLPILPIWAVNQSRAVSSGWSSFIAPRNPDEVIDALVLLLRTEGRCLDSEMPTLLPWYRYYKGSIKTRVRKAPRLVENDEAPVAIEGDRVYATSQYTIQHPTPQSTVVHFSELPVYRSFIWYKNTFEAIQTQIPEMDLSYNTGTVHVDVTVRIPLRMTASQIDELFPTTLAIQNSNMVLLGDDGIPFHIRTIHEGLRMFYAKRLPYYAERCQRRLLRLEQRLGLLNAKLKFLDYCFVSNQISLSSIGKHGGSQALTQQLDEHNIPKEALQGIDLLSVNDEKIRSLEEEIRQLEQSINQYRQQTPAEEWIADLQRLQNAIRDYYAKENVDCLELTTPKAQRQRR